MCLGGWGRDVCAERCSQYCMTLGLPSVVLVRAIVVVLDAPKLPLEWPWARFGHFSKVLEEGADAANVAPARVLALRHLSGCQARVQCMSNQQSTISLGNQQSTISFVGPSINY